MESTKDINLAAAARVAKRVELKSIRLSELSASSAPPRGGLLEPEVRHECTPSKSDDHIEVVCAYHIHVKSGDADLVTAQLTYLLSYSLVGEEPIEQTDLEQFAFANGTYHSWPFVRQLVFDLTARMGYPPYTLPVFQFNPKPKAAPPATPSAEDTSVQSPQNAEGAPS